MMIMLVLLVGFAAYVLVYVLRVRRMRRDEIARHRALKKTPHLPIGKVMEGSMVNIRGTVMASEEGVVRSPLSNKEAVLYRIDLSHFVGGGRYGGTRQTIHLRTEKDRREFIIDDGSGQIRIAPENGVTLVPITQYGGPVYGKIIGGAPVERCQMTPDVEQWARTRTGKQGTFMAEERLLSIGDNVLALGLCERDPQKGLIIRNHKYPGPDLLTSTMNETEIIAHYASRAKMRNILLASSLSTILIGSALIAFLLLK